MKLNPAKCSFGVALGRFLGYIVTQRGIEVNPKKSEQFGTSHPLGMSRKSRD